MRSVVALVAVLIGCGFLSFVHVAGAGGISTLGKGLFGLLTWLTLLVALSAGLFFTSDCLSEEKREGTIGFLFLTDLRGHDVVFGKMLATSLRAFLAVVATFPILAVTLLMGGVTGAQFWKTMLALVNGLFFSLSAGLLVSAISRDSQRAMWATLLLLFALVLGGPLADASIASAREREFAPVLSLVSPGYAFVIAGSWGANPFWLSLAASHVAGWMMLGAACVLIPRTWQERRTVSQSAPAGWAHWIKYGGRKRRSTLRKLIERNPALWLACRERWQTVVVFGATLAGVGVFLYSLASDGVSTGMWIGWSFLGGLVSLLYYLGVASQSPRFFADARRNGMLELLLVTPVDGRQMVQGQWQGLLLMFGLPLGLFLCVQFAGNVLAQSSMQGMAMFSVAGEQWGLILAVALTSVVVTLANLIALCWFGMWMGLTSRNATLATLKTIAFVQIIPWFVIAFASSMISALVLIPGLRSKTMVSMQWFPWINMFLGAALSLGKDVFFIVLARRRLYPGFREMAVRAISPVRLAVPPPRSITAPPIIPGIDTGVPKT